MPGEEVNNINITYDDTIGDKIGTNDNRSNKDINKRMGSIDYIVNDCVRGSITSNPRH